MNSTEHPEQQQYLPGAAKCVHVVKDGDELPVLGRVQDVTVDLQVLHHDVHQVGAELQSDDVGPAGVVSLQGGARALLHLQPGPLLPGEDAGRLQHRSGTEFTSSGMAEFRRDFHVRLIGRRISLGRP